MKTLDVYPLPTLFDPETLQGTCAVAVDVLRATTTVLFALAAGAERVVPLLDVEEAIRRRAEYPDGSVVLGGERGGKRIDGFDLGNSPKSFSPEVVAGKTVLFTTTNGTVAMNAARFAEPIFLACFVNAVAVVDMLSSFQQISIVCAGTDGQPTEEDILLAGCLTERLQRRSGYAYRLNVQATTAMELWSRSFSLKQIIGEETIPVEALARILRTSRGGSNLMELGMGEDILTASQLDTINFVPQIQNGAVVRSRGQVHEEEASESTFDPEIDEP